MLNNKQNIINDITLFVDRNASMNFFVVSLISVKLQWSFKHET